MDSLFYLINSLTRSEKRLFRLNAQTYHKDNAQVLQLFNAYENASSENDKSIGKDLKLRYHAVIKKKLLEQILLSLSSQQANKNQDHNQELIKIRFLISKRQDQHAEKRIKRLKRTLHELDQFSALLETLSIEKNLVLTSDILKGTTITDLLIEEKEAISKLQQVNYFMGLYHKAFKLLKEKGVKEVKTIIEERHLSNDYKHKTFSSEKYRLYFLSIVFHGQDKLSSYLKELVDLFKQYPHSKKFDARAELFAHYAYSHNLLDLNMLKDLDPQLVAMENIKVNTPALEATKTTLLLLIQIPFYSRVFKFNESDSHIRGLEKTIKEIEPHASRTDLLSIYYLMAKYLFYLESNRKSTRWIKRFTDIAPKEEITSLVIELRIIEYLNHCNQDNIDLAESLHRRLSNIISSSKLDKKNKYLELLKVLALIYNNGELNSKFKLSDAQNTLIHELAERSNIEFDSWMDSLKCKEPLWVLIKKKYTK